MSKGNDRAVYRLSKGKWANRRIGSQKVTSVHRTQTEAIGEAVGNLMAEGGGELATFGEDRGVRNMDTIRPGNDPFLPRSTAH